MDIEGTLLRKMNLLAIQVQEATDAMDVNHIATLDFGIIGDNLRAISRAAGRVADICVDIEEVISREESD